MIITTKGSIKRNFRIANKCAIDMHIGKRVRLRRTLHGMSQEQFGVGLNIASQQVQKCELCGNRVSNFRLWDINQILDVPISYFFDYMSQDIMKSLPRRVSH